jgi:hypothetical protein
MIINFKKYNESNENDFRLFTFDEVLKSYMKYYALYMHYNKDTKKYHISLELCDVMCEDEYDDEVQYNWDKYYIQFIRYIENHFLEILNIKNINKLKLDYFLFIRFLIIIDNEYYQYAECNIHENDITLYYNDMTVYDLFSILTSTLQKLIYTYNYDYIKYTEDIIKSNKNIFKDEYFNDIIYNNEYLLNKYNHYIDANKFDLL